MARNPARNRTKVHLIIFLLVLRKYLIKSGTKTDYISFRQISRETNNAHSYYLNKIFLIILVII